MAKNSNKKIKRKSIPGWGVVVIAILAVVGAVLLVKSFALSPTYETINGYVHNSNGSPMANIPIANCVNPDGSIATNSAGQFSFTLESSKGFCLRVQNVGAATVTAVENRPDHLGAPSYEYQSAVVNCYHNPYCGTNEQTWDLADNHGDFLYSFNVKSTAIGPTVSQPPRQCTVVGALLKIVTKNC